MKIVVRFLLAAILCGFWALPSVKAQTLGEVLRAVQNRNQLLGEMRNVTITLSNEAYPTYPAQPTVTVQQIDWDGISKFPTDAEVDALPIGSQVQLLRKAWALTDSLAIYFFDLRGCSSGSGQLSRSDRSGLLGGIELNELSERVDLGNFSRIVKALAARVSQLKAVPCTVLAHEKQLSSDDLDPDDAQPELPTPPIGLPTNNLEVTSEGSSVSGLYFNIYIAIYGNGSAPVDEPSYFHVGSAGGTDPVKGRAPASFAGRIQAFTAFDYFNSGITGGLVWPNATGGDSTSNTLQHPGNYRWLDVPIAKGADASLSGSGIFGGNLLSLNFPGSWQTSDEGGPWYQQLYAGQSSTLMNAFNDPDYPGAYGYLSWGTSFYSQSVFVADFGQEFSAGLKALPEPFPSLQIEPDLDRNKLKIRLARDPINDCELDWSFPTSIIPGLSEDPETDTPDRVVHGAISARNVLRVRGGGNWDVVFSGKPEDREPTVQWDDWYVQDGRWADFVRYSREWWQPVLTQLKCATCGINVTQVNDYKYRIDFYRADQIGAKDATTGLYAFAGTPVESFTVENPESDYAQAGVLRITTSKLIYDLGLTQEEDDEGYITSSTWTLSETEVAAPNNEVLHKDVEVNPGTSIATTQVDGQSLPTITTSYGDETADPLGIIETVEDAGAEGTRTTDYNYNYTYDPRGYALSYYPELTQVTQTGGVNPYSADYDDNELLTNYSSGSNSFQISYSGNTFTRTDKFNGATIRTVATAYSGGLAATTATAGGVADATAATKFYPGSDTAYPWGLKLVRGFDGALTTYSYAWSGTDFVITQESGRGANSTAETVAAGTRTITKINAAGKVFFTEVYDIESSARVDFATATTYQTGTAFPTGFSRPLTTTESVSYDAQGQILSQKDRLGIETVYTRDGLDRVTKAVRAPLTWDISYNPGHLGRFVTLSTTGQSNRTRDEQTSPFGARQKLTISGPEAITVTRTETTSNVTTQTANSTTQQSTNQSVNKGNLVTAVTGNATEPWNVTYSFPGSGWKQTTTHANASALTTATTFDAAGRVIKEEVPGANGSGTAATTYAYTNGQLTMATDPTGVTQYSYQPDGSLQQTSRGGRFVSVNRTTSTLSQIKWEWKDATGDVLWQQIYHPQSQVTEDYPCGKTARLITTTPQISGQTSTLSAAGPTLSQTASWVDGAPSAGSLTSGAASASWSALANNFSEVTSQTVKPGAIAGNALTTTLDPLGLPSASSGLVTANYGNSFDSTTGWTSSVTRNGNHTLIEKVSPKGDPLGTTGYGVPDAPLSAPSYGSAITTTLSTLAGSTPFTYNLDGTLKSRQFPDGSAESFTYDANGAPATWTTPRASFNFTPNPFGQPTQIGGAGTIGYDLAGRVGTVTDAAGTHTQTYVDGQPDVLTHTAGVLAGQSVDHDPDGLGRLQTLKFPGNVSIGYVYNGTNGALSGVTTAGGVSGTWSNYDAVTGQGKTLTLGPLSTVTAWDGMGRVTSQSSTAASAVSTYTRAYDGDGHCYSANTPDGSVTYAFDANGWLHTVTGAGQNATYGFDEAGRLAGATDYRPSVRLNNSLTTVIGSVALTATVTINNAAVTVNPTTGVFSQTYTAVPAGWNTYTVRGTLAGAGNNGTDAVAESEAQIFVPPASETLAYDASGNRKADARWTQTWNTLEQMTVMVESNAFSPATATRLDCTYDLEGHRVQKVVSVGGQVTKRTTTLWDGWRPVMEIDYQGGSTHEVARRYYTWGPDVSGSFDGAAGIGGLLEIYEKKGSATTRSLPIYDGIGNVIGLVDGTSGVRVASYKYGAFGEVLSVYGVRAASCPFRFQTRLYDDETGLSYFGKRYYDAKTQTWLSRDPMREEGGINLYAYCQNDPVGHSDPIGLADWFDVDVSDATALKMFLPLNYGGPLGSRKVAMYSRPSGRTIGEDIIYARSMANSSITAMVQGAFYGGAALRIAGGTGEIVAGVAAAPESGGSSLLLAGNGIDNAVAGLRTLSSDTYQPALLESAITDAAGNGLLGNGLYATTQLGVGFTPRALRGLNSVGQRLAEGGMLPGNAYARQAGSVINPFAAKLGSAARGLDQTYSLGLQSSRSTVLQANRGLYDDFIASGGKLIRQRDVAQFASDGVTPVLGRYNTSENSISLFKGSNLSTISEELIHFRQIQNGGYLYKPFPKSMIPGLESDASTVLQQWGFKPQ